MSNNLNLNPEGHTFIVYFIVCLFKCFLQVKTGNIGICSLQKCKKKKKIVYFIFHCLSEHVSVQKYICLW